MTTYEGWTNYPTWNIKLWIDNDQGEAEYWAERAQEAFDEAESCKYWNKSCDALLNLSKEMESYYDDQAADLTGVTGPFADLMNYALGQVDWSEIADSLLNDVDGYEG